MASAPPTSGGSRSPASEREGQSLILLRYVLIAAGAYLFLFEDPSSPAVIAMVIAAALLSNVLLSRLPEAMLMRPVVVALIVCTDICWIAFGLWYKGKLGTDIFFLYFFVLFLAAMGQNLLLIVGAGVLISLVDLALFVAPGESQARWTSPSLIRIPFIFTASLFYGYLTDRWKREHRWVLLEKEFSQKLAHIVNEQTQDLQRLYEEAKGQAIDLEKATRVKNEFLSFMSHELRTPLSIIMGYVGIVRDGAVGEVTPDQQRMLNKALSHSIGLLGMINSILQATMMESQALKVISDGIKLKEFIEDLRLFYGVPLKEGVALVWDYASELPVVETDIGKLRWILQNLINNAMKFTEDGRITVRARVLNGRETDEQRHEGSVQFTVSDTGIGIPHTALPTIFEMFRQVDSSPTRSYTGIGMGLYIVKKLTELLGGAVEVESQVKKGSTFTVTIPCVMENSPLPIDRIGQRSGV